MRRKFLISTIGAFILGLSPAILLLMLPLGAAAQQQASMPRQRMDEIRHTAFVQESGRLPAIPHFRHLANSEPV